MKDNSAQNNPEDLNIYNYILKYRKPIPCNDIRKFGRFFEHHKRGVRRTYFKNGFVSTVFLGIDHKFGEGPPILFETMIYMNGEFTDYQTRCSTWRQALRMHWDAVDWVKRQSKTAFINL